MLRVSIPEREYIDDDGASFVTIKGYELQMEHSLLSISKWEAKWQKPFLSEDEKTTEEFLDYFRCMTLNKNVPDYIYMTIPSDDVKRILDYIKSSQTATTITSRKPPGTGAFNNEIVTSELIYYWMVEHGIPFECEKWHLNRLLTLIQVCNVKRSGGDKMNKNDLASYYRSVNAARRAKSKKR